MTRVCRKCRSGCTSCPHNLNVLDDGEDHLRHVVKSTIGAAFTVFLGLCYGSFHDNPRWRKRRTQTMEGEVETEFVKDEKGEAERGWDLEVSDYGGLGGGQ